jgi:hypothetical protein
LHRIASGKNLAARSNLFAPGVEAHYRGISGFFYLIGGAAAFACIVAGLNWIRAHYGQQVQSLSFFGNLLLILVGLFFLFLSGLALWAHIERLASPYLPPDIRD